MTTRLQDLNMAFPSYNNPFVLPNRLFTTLPAKQNETVINTPIGYYDPIPPQQKNMNLNQLKKQRIQSYVHGNNNKVYAAGIENMLYQPYVHSIQTPFNIK